MMPPAENLYDYRKDFGSGYHQARRLAPKLEQWISTIRAEKISPYISPDDRVLEYGVGFGWNLSNLQCAEKTGFDLTPELRDPVQSKGIRFVSDEKAIERNHYDKVICHHVLEHVRNPLETLKRIQTSLKPAGCLLLFVPYERERKYWKFSTKNRAHHLFSWTPASFAKLALAADLQVESLQVMRFRFDRLAALFASRLNSGLRLYRLIRFVGGRLAPEFELFLKSFPST